MKISVALLLALTSLPLVSSVSIANSNRQPFEPASSVEQNLRQHERLPDPADEAWWIPTGADMAWNNKNIQQLFPTVPVYRDGPVRKLAYALNPEIDQYPVATPDGEMGFAEFLRSEHSTSMGVVILHRGEIVFEQYARMREYEKPIWWSVTKVFASSLVAVLEDRGLVDVSFPVEHYLPELKDSDFCRCFSTGCPRYGLGY